MAQVSCGLCGWSQEVDENLPVPHIAMMAEKFYAEHMLEDHSVIAHTDVVVQKYVRLAAASLAPTNGQLTSSHD